jgi:hypothetical protein
MVRRPLECCRPLYMLNCQRLLLKMLIWDRSEPLRESGGPLVGKGGECDMKSLHLQGCSHCLCQLRTEWLVPMSKYWTYWSHIGDIVPVNRCSLWPTDAWIFCTASMAVVGEKLGMDPRIGQPVCCGLGREPFFSGAVDLFNSVDNSWKVVIYEDCTHEAYEWHTWTGVKSVCIVCIRFPLQGVHRFE